MKVLNDTPELDSVSDKIAEIEFQISSPLEWFARILRGGIEIVQPYDFLTESEKRLETEVKVLIDRAVDFWQFTNVAEEEPYRHAIEVLSKLRQKEPRDFSAHRIFEPRDGLKDLRMLCRAMLDFQKLHDRLSDKNIKFVNFGLISSTLLIAFDYLKIMRFLFPDDKSYEELSAEITKVSEELDSVLLQEAKKISRNMAEQERKE